MRDAVEADLKELRNRRRLPAGKKPARHWSGQRHGSKAPVLLTARAARTGETRPDFVMQLDNIRLSCVTSGLLAAYRVARNREYERV